jgi:hypothetical protein
MMTLKFFVKENGKDFSLLQMSEPETYAISECVMNLLPVPKDTSCWFEADTCIFVSDDEEEPTYGLLRYFAENPNPKNGSLAEASRPKEIPQSILDALQGKRFPVRPKQYGVNSWGESVEILFESVNPKQGIKASELIKLALQTK